MAFGIVSGSVTGFFAWKGDCQRSLWNANMSCASRQPLNTFFFIPFTPAMWSFSVWAATFSRIVHLRYDLPWNDVKQSRKKQYSVPVMPLKGVLPHRSNFRSPLPECRGLEHVVLKRMKTGKQSSTKHFVQSWTQQYLVQGMGSKGIHPVKYLIPFPSPALLT